MAIERKLTIHFTDGSQLSFNFPVQADSDEEIAARISGMLQQQELAIEADNTLFVFPMHNIKYIQAYPPPEALPDTVIRGASVSE